MEAADLAAKGLNFRHQGFGIRLAKEGAVNAVDAALRLGDTRDHPADARRFSQEAFFAFGQAIDDVVKPRKICSGAGLARNHRGPRLEGFHPLARIGRNQPLDLLLADPGEASHNASKNRFSPAKGKEHMSSQATGCQRYPCGWRKDKQHAMPEIVIGAQAGDPESDPGGDPS